MIFMDDALRNIYGDDNESNRRRERLWNCMWCVNFCEPADGPICGPCWCGIEERYEYTDNCVFEGGPIKGSVT